MKNGKLKKFFCKKELNEIEELKKELHRLKKENKKLKIMNNFKDEVISAISHEFKNPISIINGYIETILSSNLDIKMRDKFLNKIHKNTTRLSELIDRLYLVTKLENKKLTPKISVFSLKNCAQNIAEGLNERVSVKGEEIKIKADKNLIEIVLNNLISNALKYSKDKVTVEISEEKVCVTDRGKGIDKKDIELIKNKFYRVAKNDWDNSLGLGLAIVEHILKLHGTHLEIESEKGKGSRFCFDITSLKDKAHRL